MARILLILLLVFPLHKAYAFQEGNCYKPRKGRKAKHLCVELVSGRRTLEELKVLKRRVRVDIPNLEKRLKLRGDTIELLKEQKAKAEKAVVESAKALNRTEKVNSRLNVENKALLVSTKKYKEESEKMKAQRWTFLFIGVGAGIVITSVAVIAIAIVAK